MRSALRVSIRPVLALAFVLSMIPAAAYAGGPLEVCSPGVPYTWPTGGTNIPWNPDQGNLGPFNNANAIAFVRLSFAQWDAVPSASTTYLQGAPIPEDVNGDNFFPYLFPSAPDGLSAIVFDDNGEIFDLLFGPDSGVLGFAGPEWLRPSTCSITEGVAFLNGPAFTSLQAALDITVHELGHYQNLAHTVVNGQIILGDHTGPSPNNTFPFPPTFAQRIETMYPFYFGTAAGTSSPDRDDVAMLSTLYPGPTFFSTTATITGRILASNGTTPKTGFNVIARNIANPYVDAVSAISSDFTRDYTPPAAPFVGVYTLRGLTPGAQYAVYVDGIMDGGFSTPPGILPGPEEFYNGANESNDSASDIPKVFTTVSAPAGGIADDIDIIFNRFRPGDPLPLGDEGALLLALPFKFRMCGTWYEEAVLNANGTLSFGGPNNDLSDSVPEFLAGPPHIAGLWDDLDAGAAGTVTFSESKWEFTVTFSNVPEWGTAPGTSSNTFSITLKRLVNLIEVDYGSLTMRDGLAGVSCGGAITSGFETPVDLSAKSRGLINLLFQPAVFEQFVAPTATSPGSPNDLANLTLRYTPTTDYFDLFEPNDQLSRARRVPLPFNTIPVHRFTELDNAEDVDFFSFKANKGDMIVAEILSSQIDTVLGLFDESGRLLAADDDSGAGPLSRIVFTIPANGEYAIAVSSFPDFEFDGGGEGGTGRYVLDIHVQPPPETATMRSLAAPGDPWLALRTIEPVGMITTNVIPPTEIVDRRRLDSRRA